MADDKPTFPLNNILALQDKKFTHSANPPVFNEAPPVAEEDPKDFGATVDIEARTEVISGKHFVHAGNPPVFGPEFQYDVRIDTGEHYIVQNGVGEIFAADDLGLDHLLFMRPTDPDVRIVDGADVTKKSDLEV